MIHADYIAAARSVLEASDAPYGVYLDGKIIALLGSVDNATREHWRRQYPSSNVVIRLRRDDDRILGED